MSLRGAGRPGVVSVKESSRGPSWLRPPPRAPAARGELRTARGPGSGSRTVRPLCRWGRYRRCASPGDCAPDPRPPVRDGVPSDRRRGKPGTPAPRRPRFPPRLPGPSRYAGLGRTRWGLRGRHSGSVRAAGSAARAAQPPAPPGSLGVAPARRRLDAEVAVLPFSGRRKRAGGRAGGGAGSAHFCAPQASVWPPRSDVDPPAPDLNRP